MLRYLQVQGNRPVNAIRKVSADMKQGMVVSVDYANDEMDKATGVGYYLVDIARNYDGINAAIFYPDDHFEDIEEGLMALQITPTLGDRFATDQLTIGALKKGDPIKAVAGLFVAAESSDAYGWVYQGTYADPTGKTLYIVERVPNATV